MRDEDAVRLRAGEIVQVTAVVVEPYTGTGAMLLEVREANCAQRFWFPVASVEPVAVPAVMRRVCDGV